MKVYKVVRPERVSLFAEGKYRLKYPRDSLVSALPGTLGIMCFLTRRQARRFVGGLDLRAGEFVLLEVEGFGEPSYPRAVSWLSSEEAIDRFYEDGRPYLNPKAPEGTVCFPQVHVCD